jgi:hypothetical protein
MFVHDSANRQTGGTNWVWPMHSGCLEPLFSPIAHIIFLAPYLKYAPVVELVDTTVSKTVEKSCRFDSCQGYHNIVNRPIFKLDKSQLRFAAREYLKFICRAAGYHTAMPDDDEPFDLLVDFGVGYKRVQVKTSTYHKKGRNDYSFALIKTRNNGKKRRKVSYTKDEVDFYFLMDIKFNCWLIPFNMLRNHCGTIPANRYSDYKIEMGR